MLIFPVSALKNSRDEKLASEIRAGATAIESNHFKLWYPEVFMNSLEAEMFLEHLESAYKGIENKIGKSFDAIYYKNKSIEVFLSPKKIISHVYGGYRQRHYSTPWIFLPVRMVKWGFSPYSHELTHLFTWNFTSHSLREGLACWMQIQLAEQGMGLKTHIHRFENRHEADSIVRLIIQDKEFIPVIRSIARTGLPSPKITKPGGSNRSKYYTACYSFVAYLLDSVSMVEFMQLYSADKKVFAKFKMAGKTVLEWKETWIKYLSK
jgi:hypothetical protein